MYKKRVFNACKVRLLRNFPIYENNISQNNYRTKDVLNLVYIGGVNKYRGIQELAQYVKMFNSGQNRKLIFYIYILIFCSLFSQDKYCLFSDVSSMISDSF